MKYLAEYLADPSNAEVNFRLGLEYELMGQTGAAISFYLRTAERTNDDTLQYESLLRMALCFERQRTRDDTQKVLLQKAISLIMDRPEAHFLLARAHERKQEYHEGWSVVNIALRVCRWDHPGLLTNVEYPGRWGLLFEHGVCAWWVGHTEESRRTMFELLYSWPLDQTHIEACRRNLQVCGWPRLTTAYDPSQTQALRQSFPGQEKITRNWSQSLQDIFVLMANQGQRDRWYLEIGSAEPYYNNNTALLEQQGWSGVSLDIDVAKVQDFRNQRRNPVLCQDALTVDFAQLLAQHRAPKDLGYLQVDCDPAENSYRILTRLPWDQYRFAAVTFEHDYYADQSVRDRSRAFLTDLGYQMVAGNIAFTVNDKHYSYEDWWIHPDLVPDTVVKQLVHTHSDAVPAEQYVFPKTQPSDPVQASAEPVLAAPMIARPRHNMFNSEAQPGFWVVDNFYSDPDWVREFALKQEYEVNHDGERGYIGTRTCQQFLFEGLREQFEHIMNRRILRWEEHGMNGRFQYNIAGQPLVYHCDDQAWAGMLYLTPDAPWASGTRTHALKNTTIRHRDHPRIKECFLPGSRNFDGTRFDTVDQLGNVYNRLVLFNAGYLHSAVDYFGFTPENSRLWHMFFFD